MTIYTFSKTGNQIGQTDVNEVVHSAGYTYTQYGALAPHQKSSGK